jgi:hypothetical protein
MKRIVKFLFSNLDTIIAIVVSILAAAFGIFGGNQTVLLAGISTTLGIIAYGTIRDRINRENLSEHINLLEKTLSEMSSGKIKSDNFFVNRTKLPSLSDNMKKAKSTLDMAGTSLLSVGITYQASLREVKESGVKIRLLISNPDNPNLQEYLSMRYLEAETAVVHANQVRASLTSLAPLISSNRKGGNIQVRITDHVQTFSYIGSDVNKTDGYMQVEFYLNKIGLEKDPIFFLEAGKDVHWFSEFKKQFEFLWDNAVEIDTKMYL